VTIDSLEGLVDTASKIAKFDFDDLKKKKTAPRQKVTAHFLLGGPQCF
jgi:hypothetical protein